MVWHIDASVKPMSGAVITLPLTLLQLQPASTPVIIFGILLICLKREHEKRKEKKCKLPFSKI